MWTTGVTLNMFSVQRLGLLAEAPLMAMSKGDESRRIWPIAVNALDIPNVGPLMP